MDSRECKLSLSISTLRQRASRRGQSRKALPTIARRIVFVHFVRQRPALDETADDVGSLALMWRPAPRA
jgi:hypothetical protein